MQSLDYLEKEGRGRRGTILFPSSKATTGRYTAGGERADWHNLDTIWTHSRFCSLTLTETLHSLDERRF